MLGSARGGPPAPAWLEAEEMAEAGAIPAQLTPHGPGSTVRCPRTLLSSRPPPLPLGEGVCREPGGETGGGGGDRLVWVGWEHGERPPPHAAPAVPRNRPQRPPEGCTYLVPCAVSLCQGAPIMLTPGPSPSPETAPCVALPHCARALGLLGLVGLSPSWPRWHARL